MSRSLIRLCLCRLIKYTNLGTIAMNIINESKVRTFPYYKDENYSVYEDGRMFSHIRNKFLKRTVSSTKEVIYGKHGPIARIVWQSVHGGVR